MKATTTFLKSRRLVLGGVIAVLVLGGAFWFRGGNDKERGNVPTFTVQQGPLTISVSSTGTLQSRDKETILCDLEGRSTIIWLVEEGVHVAKGDLLIEFNASELNDKRKEQEVQVANTEANVTTVTEKKDLVDGESESTQADRESELRQAKTDLIKYAEGDAPQQLRQYEADITIANEQIQRAAERLEWSQKLADEGFLTRSELQADELALQQQKINLEMTLTRLHVFTNYTRTLQEESLRRAINRSERNLTRTVWQNKSNIRQVEAELRNATRDYERAMTRLNELDDQISKCKVYAPVEGITLYATTVQIARRQWWVTPLAVGASTVQRQELIYIPLDSGMIVEAMIPEASLPKIDLGMKVNVKVDAFPTQLFEGKLAKIGLLPDGQSSQLNPDLKFYKCEVEADFQGAAMRPGMSCNVEFIKERYEDVVFVPVQCVVRESGQSRVYVRDKKAGWIPRDVEVGLDNNRMIHIIDGLAAGEDVMLAPPIRESAVSEKEKDKDAQEKSRREKAGEKTEEKKAEEAKPEAKETEAEETTPAETAESTASNEE